MVPVLAVPVRAAGLAVLVLVVLVQAAVPESTVMLVRAADLVVLVPVVEQVPMVVQLVTELMVAPVPAAVPEEQVVPVVLVLVDQRERSSRRSDPGRLGPRRPEQMAAPVEALVVVLVVQRVRSSRQLPRGLLPKLVVNLDLDLDLAQVTQGRTGPVVVQLVLNRQLVPVVLQGHLSRPGTRRPAAHRHLMGPTASRRRRRGIGRAPLVGRRSQRINRGLPGSGWSSRCGTQREKQNTQWKAGMTYEH